jgi:hypothetical protein
MTANWLRAGAALADVLARENAALQRLDFPAAVALVADKEAALANLAAHGEEMQQQPPPAEAVTLGRHLNALAAENRTLLERAITVQTRIVGIIARAARPPTARSYAANGQHSQPRRAAAMALSARA